MYIKKIIHIVIAFILLISSVGVVVSVHYCHDELASISIFKEVQTCCTNPNCCQSETISIQFDKDYVVEDIQQSENALALSSLINFVEINQTQFDNTERIASLYSVRKPPLIESDIYIQIQRLLI
ncbi:MAG: hypothetical protein HOD63_06230 [Bacteroidetes bacterium]|jgi:hypothetical protein|nr:hypothetical protein [Bacteroidota bacterium]MBT5529495.1 hypothetical protein [Cytophagia bacterium]MBT4338167.1 hypothetical protein [Bacteroidota bacterium]MBT4728362.1 hypothetical protein [Bacteroidota bacterium]MBT4968112.1 hypothetical protein [Bacteroidota bacterium]